MIAPTKNHYLRRSSVSTPREQRTAWQVFRLILECIFVVVLIMGIATAGYTLYRRIAQQNFFPLKRVIIQEPLRYGDMHEVSEIIRNHHQRDLFNMDVSLLAEEIQRLSWIAEASVYKHWPDAVEIKLVERKPVVRWGSRAFLDASGEVFTIPDNDKLRGLATIHGPDGYEQHVLSYWQQIAPWLRVQQLDVRQLTLDQRLVWHVELADGLDVILGRDQLNDRLKKLAVVNGKVINPYHRYIEAVDLRYHDGFSVRWKAGVKPVTAEKNPGRGSDKTLTAVAAPPIGKTAAKTGTAEKPRVKAGKEKPAAKAAVAEKTPAKEKTSAKPVLAEKTAAKEAKEKAPAKAVAAVKENKEKTVAKTATAEKVSPKAVKEKTPAKPVSAEKTSTKTAAKEKTAVKGTNKEKETAKGTK